MIFTDDDLKRLKAKEGYWKTTVKMNEGQSESWGFVDGDKIDALLARLEAAERACLFFQNSLRLGDVDDGVLSAWRKAAGK